MDAPASSDEQPSSTPPLHALLLPGPGVGHFNGSMLLAKALLSAGFSLVTVACFAKSYAANAKKIEPLVAAAARHGNIRLEVVPDGLPDEEQHYHGLFTSGPQMKDGLVQLIRRLAEQQHQPVTCLISDAFMALSQDVADTCDIPRIDLWTASATSYLLILGVKTLAANGHLPFKEPPKRWKSENPIFIDWVPGLAGFPLDELPDDFTHPADVESDAFLQRCIVAGSKVRDMERALIHTVEELESSALEGLASAYGIQAYATGPLIQYALNDSANGSSGKDVECMKWLNAQADSSVIYVSFGSNATLPAEEILELALGLEASAQPFLWVIRTDAVKGDQSGFSLPEGFELRIKTRGLIVPWAPQVAVLGHPAVGGFLTHCGWNSLLESVWKGVPLLGCPRGADQRVNVRFIAQEWGVGLEMGRTEEGGIARADVEDGVKALMVGEKGKQARSKARQLARELRKNYSKVPANLLAFAHDMHIRHELKHGTSAC